MLQKELFDIPAEVTFLNCANMSPQLKSITEKGIAAVNQKKHPWQLQAADWFTGPEELRALAAQIYTTSTENVAFIPSASYGLALAARNIKIAPGKTILVLDREFPSNYYVWEQLAKLSVVKRATGENWTQAILSAINENTGLIAIPQCHWTDGSFIDLEVISRKAHAAGIPLVLDLSQSLGVCPVNIDEIAPDFAVAVGYKWLMGPYGLGYMYVHPKWHETGTPLEYSWLARKGSEDFTQLVNYTPLYRSGARKFDMGEFSQFNLVPMAQGALTQILAWGIENIYTYLSGLTSSIPVLSANIPFVSCEDIPYAGHLRGITIPGELVPAIKKALSEKNIHVSFRGNAIRIAPHVYNDQQDMDRLFACLKGVTLPV